MFIITTFKFRDFSSDFPTPPYNTPYTQCIAVCDDKEWANGLFIVDDNGSGLRQTIIFRAGSSYARGNFIDVVANHWYASNQPPITDIFIDVSSNYTNGGNLYITRASQNSTNNIKVYVRVYQTYRKDEGLGSIAI